MKRLASWILVIVMLFAVCGAAFAANSPPKLGVVQTAYGQALGVIGSMYHDVTLFKGMPYAAPPVGDLRWAPPQEPAKWNGVRVFDTYEDASAQWPSDMAADPWKTDFYYVGPPNFSEDCLYLNIATTSTGANEGMPVYVWFHGGGLKHGYAYELECDPEALAAKGVVVVEVGQRLGVWANMTLPQLDAASEYGSSGNYGLMDQIKAVEWVKQNIRAFGGNPDNITIGGQSGGTTKTASFFASEYGASLINNVIWQTGIKYDNPFTSHEEAQKKAIDWLKACGLTGNETLAELRAMDTSVFLGKEADYASDAPIGLSVDGKYICYDNLKQAYEDGLFEGVNIIVGSNLGEGTHNGVGNIKDAASFYAYYREMLGDLYTKYNFEKLVPVTDANAFDTARRLSSYGLKKASGTNTAYVEMFGPKFAEDYNGGRVYAYLFSHITPGRNCEEYWWAWHSSELWYVFGSLRNVPEQREWTSWDYELADICTSYWTNFMKTGDPNGEGLPVWQPSTSGQLAHMNLGDRDTIGCVTDTYGLQNLLVEFLSANVPL